MVDADDGCGGGCGCGVGVEVGGGGVAGCSRPSPRHSTLPPFTFFPLLGHGIRSREMNPWWWRHIEFGRIFSSQQERAFKMSLHFF